MYRPKWEDEVQTAFFKCRNWQLEETLDPDSCPYHYYCNSSYPGNYPPAIDLLVMVFALLSFLATIGLMVMDTAGGSRHYDRIIRHWRRYLLPSGPLSLPITIVVMANGYRINTLFPMMTGGPAMLQLVRISAIAFDYQTSSDLKYVFLESSTISGILHAALYLDSTVLPFYTGLDALLLSTLSGECRSCVCRDTALKVGGELVVFRGWSVTTAMVVGSLCLRIVCRVWRDSCQKAAFIKAVLETLSWILIAAESIYLVILVPQPNRTWPAQATYSALFVLICLQIARKVCAWITSNHTHPLRPPAIKT